MAGFLKDGSGSVLKKLWQFCRKLWDQCLLVATIVLAYYAFRQWGATNATLIEIQKQTPAVIQSAQAAADAVKVAKDEAASSDESTQATLKLMKKQADASRSLAATAKTSAETSAKLMNQQVEAEKTLAAATHDAAETAAKQLFMSQRPRLLFATAEAPELTVDRRTFSIYFSPLVENRGQSTAQKSWLSTSADLVPSKNPKDLLQSTCNAPNGRIGRGVTVSPGEKQLLGSNLEVSIDDLRQRLNYGWPSQDGSISIVIFFYACLHYESDISTQSLHNGTGYILNISIDSQQLQRIRAFKPTDSMMDSVKLPKNSVTISPMQVVNGLQD